MGHKPAIAQEIQNRLFVDAYFGDAQLCAAAAAKVAGFKGKKKNALEVAGTRMMQRPAVKAMILDRLEKLQAGPDDVIKLLVQHLHTDMADFVVEDVDGGPKFDYRRALQLKKTRLLKGMKIKKRVYDGDEDGGGYEETEITFQLHDSQAAAYKLAQIYGMIIDRKEIRKRNLPQPIDEQDLVDKLQRLGVPEDHWPPALLARHRRLVKSTVVTSTRRVK